MKNNSTTIGDLVCLNRRGVEYFLYHGYRTEMLTSGGIIVAQNKTVAKIWFAPYTRWIAKRYLKKMNKN